MGPNRVSDEDNADKLPNNDDQTLTKSDKLASKKKRRIADDKKTE